MEKLFFATIALPANLVAVLKSAILLAEKETGYQWVHQQDARADVLFIGAQQQNDERDRHYRPGQIVVSVGEAAHKEFFHLDTPLQLAAVNHILLALAESVQTDRDAGLRFSNSQALPSIWDLNLSQAEITATQGSAPAPQEKRYHLKTWPPAGVIGNQRLFVRAAALLSSKQLSSAELAEKTGLSLADCRDFLGRLSQAKCLQVIEP